MGLDTIGSPWFLTAARVSFLCLSFIEKHSPWCWHRDTGSFQVNLSLEFYHQMERDTHSLGPIRKKVNGDRRPKTLGSVMAYCDCPRGELWPGRHVCKNIFLSSSTKLKVIFPWKWKNFLLIWQLAGPNLLTVPIIPKFHQQFWWGRISSKRVVFYFFKTKNIYDAFLIKKH